MGKVRRQRRKCHTTSNNSVPINDTSMDISHASHLNIIGANDIFSGLDIPFNSLKTNLNDDAKSVISCKSIKSELKPHMAKKNKLKMRHTMLLQKLDKINQTKKEEAVRKKRKHNVIIGDTNSLRDALPSIDHLIKSKDDLKPKAKEKGNKKPIAKALRRKKEMIQNVNMFKTLLNSKIFKTDPVNVVKEHVCKMVASGTLEF